MKLKKILSSKGIHEFIIFHPSAQYNYKIYPKALRNKLLMRLNSLGISIVVTGGSSEIDLEIKNEIDERENIYNFIGYQHAIKQQIYKKIGFNVIKINLF